MKRNDYRTRAKAMTDAALLEAIERHSEYMLHEKPETGVTSHLTKVIYMEQLARKRGLKGFDL